MRVGSGDVKRISFPLFNIPIFDENEVEKSVTVALLAEDISLGEDHQFHLDTDCLGYYDLFHDPSSPGWL